MRRASSKLLFHIPKLHTNQTLISLISKDFSSSIDISLKPHLNKSQSFLFPNLDSHGFWPCAAHNFNTLAGSISPKLPFKEESDIKKAFQSAESVDEMLEAFKSLETCIEGKYLGLACLRIGLKLHHQGEDPEKALSFAQRALKILDDDNNENSERWRLYWPIAMALKILGSSSLCLKRFNDSLGYFNRVLNSNFNCDDKFFLPISRDIQFNLFIVKTAMGCREEAIAHLKKALEIKEEMFGKDSRKVGDANLDMAEAYVAVWNFQEALPFCSKALDIHKTKLGNGSVEVAYDRRLLGIIYTGLDKHEKALEENQLSRRVLKKWVQSTDLLLAEIDDANRRGRHEQAIEIQTRAKILLKETLTMLEKLPPEQHSVGSVSATICRLLLKTARISRLLLMTAKVEEAIPFLKDAAERLKEIFGSKHFGVGYVYNNLGAAYLVLGRPQSAAQVFAHVKEIMEVTPCSHHMDAIEACQNLSKAYAAMGRYPLAINFQEKVVEGLEGHGPSAQGELDEAAKVLEQLKEKASAEALLAYNNSSPAGNR